MIKYKKNRDIKVVGLYFIFINQFIIEGKFWYDFSFFQLEDGSKVFIEEDIFYCSKGYYFFFKVSFLVIDLFNGLVCFFFDIW